MYICVCMCMYAIKKELPHKIRGSGFVAQDSFAWGTFCYGHDHSHAYGHVQGHGHGQSHGQGHDHDHGEMSRSGNIY